MSQYQFKVRISPLEVMDTVKNKQPGDLVYEEINDLGNNQYIGTLIFEKYFFRVKNRVALIVIFDNLQGDTEVRVVATGSSQGLLINFDWGAAKDFAFSVKRILDIDAID